MNAETARALTSISHHKTELEVSKYQDKMISYIEDQIKAQCGFGYSSYSVDPMTVICKAHQYVHGNSNIIRKAVVMLIKDHFRENGFDVKYQVHTKRSDRFDGFEKFYDLTIRWSEDDKA